MEVTVAKTAGFCFGVKRAVDTVYEQIGTGEVYTYGPIIHNEEVMRDLEEKGVKILQDLDALEQITSGKIVIRSHGVAKAVYDRVEAKGLELIDATCPFVKKIHKIVWDETERGNDVIIVGNASHPEVQGIMGWCRKPPFVIETAKAAEDFDEEIAENACIVAQTTFNMTKFKDVLDIFGKKGYNLTVYNTICNATQERQTETRQLASEVDAMIVIGSINSSNTQKLYDISKTECENTYYIQTLVDLDLTAFESVSRVGITAGASTPNNIIKEVLIACQR
ncbi:MAG: 4-hydroxy-3-methylbut-2-enyl diphosphate reductase [Lachnospiraceae bacterium]|nr:4-hydroxy-3-methylbut-2-enyl diphosphate reductase [Lachnospiraceae bacterium]